MAQTQQVAQTEQVAHAQQVAQRYQGSRTEQVAQTQQGLQEQGTVGNAQIRLVNIVDWDIASGSSSSDKADGDVVIAEAAPSSQGEAVDAQTAVSYHMRHNWQRLCCQQCLRLKNMTQVHQQITLLQISL